MRREERRFYFRLALALGMTVGEMLSRISARELAEWMAFYSIEPFGALIDDYRSSVALAMQAASAGGRRRAISQRDFMFSKTAPTIARQDPLAQMQLMQAFAARSQQ